MSGARRSEDQLRSAEQVEASRRTATRRDRTPCAAGRAQQPFASAGTRLGRARPRCHVGDSQPGRVPAARRDHRADFLRPGDGFQSVPTTPRSGRQLPAPPDFHGVRGHGFQGDPRARGHSLVPPPRARPARVSKVGPVLTRGRWLPRSLGGGDSAGSCAGRAPRRPAPEKLREGSRGLGACAASGRAEVGPPRRRRRVTHFLFVVAERRKESARSRCRPQRRRAGEEETGSRPPPLPAPGSASWVRAALAPACGGRAGGPGLWGRAGAGPGRRPERVSERAGRPPARPQRSGPRWRLGRARAGGGPLVRAPSRSRRRVPQERPGACGVRGRFAFLSGSRGRPESGDEVGAPRSAPGGARRRGQGTPPAASTGAQKFPREGNAGRAPGSPRARCFPAGPAAAPVAEVRISFARARNGRQRCGADGRRRGASDKALGAGAAAGPTRPRRRGGRARGLRARGALAAPAGPHARIPAGGSESGWAAGTLRGSRFSSRVK